MKKLLLTLSFCLLPLTLYGAATERGFTLTYTEPSLTACGPSTQLKPTSAPTMCLESFRDEAKQNACNNTKNQRFEMIPAGTGLFQLKSQMTGFCLRMGTGLSGPIGETSCANTADDGVQDRIFRIGPSPSQIQSNSGAGGLCLDVRSARTAGAKIMSFTCHGRSNQLFAYSLSAGVDCPLDDLAGTKIYMDVVGDGVGGTVDTVDATAKTGGGKISEKYCVPILDDATALTIEIQVTAFDESGNESERTPKLIYPVLGTRDCTPPDTTAPAGVENLRIQ